MSKSSRHEPLASAPHETFALDELRETGYNFNRLSPAEAEGLATSMGRFGVVELPVVNIHPDRRGVIVGGFHRVKAAREAGQTKLDCVTVNLEPEAERELHMRLNKHRGAPDAELVKAFFEPGELATVGYGPEDLAAWDMLSAAGAADLEAAAGEPDGAEQLQAAVGDDAGRLAELLPQLQAAYGGSPVEAAEAALAAAAPKPEPESSDGPLTLAERFGVPPLSVLDTRQGYWQNRKQEWMTLGIQAGRSRSEVLARHPTARDANFYDKKVAAEKQHGPMSTTEFIASHYNSDLGEGSFASSGASSFDPVLCEFAYRWFSPLDGQVFDPFAGGPMAGIVAAALGKSFLGVDIRPEQVEANAAQWAEVAPRLDSDAPAPQWVVGDSATVALPGELDLIFSCPPYYDLEKYSDDQQDISAMTWDDFVGTYRTIIARSVEHLRNDRFIVWQIGEVRDKKGRLRGLPDLSRQAFADAGAEPYNDAILVTLLGAVPIRAGRQFTIARKLGRTHQYVQVYVKGDWRKAVEACGEVEVTMPELIEE